MTKFVLVGFDAQNDQSYEDSLPFEHIIRRCGLCAFCRPNDYDQSISRSLSPSTRKYIGVCMKNPPKIRFDEQGAHLLGQYPMVCPSYGVCGEFSLSESAWSAHCSRLEIKANSHDK